jgi:hypothetical protein
VRSVVALCFGRLILGCLVIKASSMRQSIVLVYQSVSLIGLDGDDTHQSMHLHSGIGSKDDRHELQMLAFPEDVVIAVVEACDFKC